MLHIGISGPIAAGKTTLAQSLKQLALESGLACDIISFAYGVREVAALEKNETRRAELTNLFYSYGYDYGLSITAAMLTDRYMQQHPSTSGEKNRRLLQSIGTEVGRMIVDEDIWIRRTQWLFNGHVLDYGISDDLRFDNEAMAVDVHVGIDVKATYEGYRDWNQRTGTFGAEYTFNQHASEHALTLPPLFVVPAGFTQQDVLVLFEKLERVRKLRR